MSCPTDDGTLWLNAGVAGAVLLPVTGVTVGVVQVTGIAFATAAEHNNTHDMTSRACICRQLTERTSAASCIGDASLYDAAAASSSW
jgi:hypothetical protein